MHKARVARLMKDLENCTTQDLLGVAALLLRTDAKYAKTLTASLSDAVDIVGNVNTVTYKNVMAMLFGHKVVWLESTGDKKIYVIKAVREICALGLKEAKELVDRVPSVLPSTTISPEEAVRMLGEAGAVAVLKKA
jgi:ribosomal protein L7/L12